MDIRAAQRATGFTQSPLAGAARALRADLSTYGYGRRIEPHKVLARLRRALTGQPLARVESHRDTIRTLVTEHHAADPRLFGSVVRGDDEPGSDLDLLVDFTDEASLLDETGLRLVLTDLLRIDVDVVASDSLKEPMRSRVLREAVPV